MLAVASPVDPINLKIRDILKSNGIKHEISHVDIADAGLRGEGMVSETQLVTVNFATENIKPMNLFAKVHTKNESQVEMVEGIKAFEKEAKFYMDYIPAAHEFCKRKGRPELIDFYPKCYYADKEITIFENLVLDKGYGMFDKHKLQGYEEAQAALTTLAKHHAISYAMIQEYGGPEKFFERFSPLNFEPYLADCTRGMLEPMFENGVSMCINLLEKNPVEGHQDAINLLHNMKGKTFSFLEECLGQNDPNDLLVLNHGDYWNNNMMFMKHPGTNEIKVMAIDLQTTRYASPALDLGYYIFTSTQPDIRRTYLKGLLQKYLDIFTETSESLGFPIKLKLDELYQMFRKQFKVGFCFGLVVSAGPGYAVLKEYNTEDIGDMSNWASYMDMLMQKWIEQNPEKCKAMTGNIVECMNEYKNLIL